MKVTASKYLFVTRAEQGLTIKELADKSGVPTATISRAEHGKALSVKSAGRLCKALNTSFETLFIIKED